MRGDRVFDLFMAALCVFYLISALQLDVGTMKDTGPGFLPVLLGTVSVFVMGLILINSFRKTQKKKTEDISKEGKWRFVSCIIACCLFIPLFELLGPLVSVSVLVLALSKVWGARGWLIPVVMSIVSSVSIYIVFSIILEVPFPSGIF